MFRLSLHPDPIALEAFTAADSRSRNRRVGRHLAKCVRCQDEVRSLRALRLAASQLPSPTMRAGLFDAVERRIAEGELVLLPSLGASPRTASRSAGAMLTRALPIAAALAVAAWLVAQRSRSLEAGETVGELTVAPRTLSAPNTVVMTYRPATALASLDSVVVHAKLFAAEKYYSPTNGTYTLHRQGGRFGADITLPSDAVLATFTIGSADGKRTDDNDGRSWEFVSRDSANRPTFEGLRLQSGKHGMDDWERSFAAAKEMARLYPDRPAAVRALFGPSLALAGASKADSVVGAFRPGVEALHRRYADAAATPDVMWEMSMLGSAVRDTAISHFWLNRLKREYPRDAGTLQLSVFQIFNRPLTDAARLQALDQLWEETGGNSLQLLSDAFRLAEKLKDEAAISRWGDRFAAMPGWAGSAARSYVQYDGLRAKGESLLRASLRESPPVTRTDWQASLREQSSSPMAARGQWQLATLGGALLRDGNTVAARDTLRRAAAIAWDANTMSTLGDAALADRDTGEAVQAYAWTIADRRTTTARADSLRARLGAWATRAEFKAAVDDGARILREMVLVSTYRRPLSPTASFAEIGGTRRSLGDALPSGISVLAVVSPHCAPSIADLPALQQLKDRFAPLGIPVIAVVEEQPADAIRRSIAGMGYSGTLGFDDRAEISRSLRQYGTPQYFVIENGKTIRADSRRAADLIGVIEALRSK